MDLVEVLLAQQLGGGGSGGGITPEQLATYVKNNAIKNVESTPSTDSYIVGNVIFDKSDGKIKLCGLNTSDVKVWIDVVELWLQAYQEKITAGAGLVFDGNTLKHSNSVTPKPQRYIRATAYDAQGHAINFGVDYLVARSDYNDDFISDLHLASSLWVHVHHSPIEASSFASEVNESISADNCVFNMMDIGGTTRTRRSQKRYMGLASITDPISNTALYGGIDVTEYWYAYAQEGTGTCKIEQVFKNSYTGSVGIVFKRYGTLAFSDAGEFGTAIYTNRSAIVWGDWIPVEYPKSNLTLTNTTDFSVDTFCFSVSGGNVTIFISGLKKLVESPSSNTFATIPDCLKSANGSGGHSMLIDSNTFNTFATLSKIDPSNSLLLRGAVTTAKYYGILIYGL